MESKNDHYDSPWKEAIERYFPEFMTFYFSDAYALIDWSKEHVFLDQELGQWCRMLSWERVLLTGWSG